MIGQKEEGELPGRRKDPPRSTHEAAVAVAYVLALVFLGANFGVSCGNTESLIGSYGSQAHAFGLRHSINQLYAGLTEAELHERAFIVSGTPSDLAAYRDAQGKISGLLDATELDVRPIPTEGTSFRRLKILIRSRLNALDHRVSVRQRQGLQPAVALIREQTVSSEMPEIRSIIRRVTQDQQAEIEKTVASVQQSSSRARSALWISGIATLSLFGAAWALSGALTKAQRSRALMERASREELERQVALRTRELQLANGELEAFSYSVSHDLRSPLRALGGMTATLSESLGPECAQSSRTTLDRMVVAIRQMANRIDDLLRLSQVGTSEIARGSVDITRMVQEIAETLEHQQPHPVTVWRIQSGITTEADSRLTEIVLDNLLSNAWKFTSKQEKPVIEVGLTQSADPEIYIRDNGDGFDVPDDTDLFRPFKRFHSQSDFEGTGLGLAISHRVVTRHQGRIRVESRPGEGTTVRFTLGPTQSSAS